MLPSKRFVSYRRQYHKQKLLRAFLLGIIGIVLLGFILSFGLFAWYARDLPSPGKLSQVSSYSTVFSDREDKVLYEMYKDKNRVPVPLSSISKDLKNATIAIEDKSFYKHKGISETGILRAFFSIIFRGSIQGGSTITQQLIKNVLLDSERSAARKIRELILSMEVERRYSKDQILEMYLNDAPYGGNFWGVGTASMAYFGKKSQILSLVESAILAGLPQRPSYYSPFIGKNDSWRLRAKDVLRRMREDKYITSDQEKDALGSLEKIKFTSPKLSIHAPHFVFYVKDLVGEEYGEKLIDKGVKIKTTLSLEVQKTAEKIINEEIKKVKNLKVGNGAAVVLDSKTGELLAMVGSYDFNDEKYGKFNAALGLRQPGSAIKPVTYAVAFEKGYTPSTIVTDVKTIFPQQGEKDYIPENYDGKFRGPLELRFALGNSINVSAVKLLSMIGIKDFLQKARDMGLESLAPTEKNLNRFGLSITLGGGETRLLDLTGAFSVFARGGGKINPSSILEISHFDGSKIYKQSRSNEKQALSPESAFLISHILSDNNARIDVFGANSYLNIPGKTVAVKTGTTNDKRDNWAVGYTKSLTIGVWVGNNDNSPMDPKIASGATGASPIFYRLMIELLKKYPDGIMDKPNGINATTIDAYLGGLPKDGYPTRSEYFREGTEPKDVSPFYKKIKISKATGKLANEVEIKGGNYEEKEYIVIRENDPISFDGKNRWQEAIDAWARDQKDDKYHPPTETSDSSSDSIVVQLKSPEDKSTVSSNQVTIKGKITSISTVKNIKIYVNGSVIKSFDEDKEDIDEPISLSDGTYELRLEATNEKGKTGESVVRIGVNKPWDSPPTSTPTTTPTP